METERVDHIAAALAPEDSDAQVYRQQFVDRVGSTTAFGRIGHVSDVANVAAFFASSESDYLTGLSISVTGGAYMD